MVTLVARALARSLVVIDIPVCLAFAVVCGFPSFVCGWARLALGMLLFASYSKRGVAWTPLWAFFKCTWLFLLVLLLVVSFCFL